MKKLLPALLFVFILDSFFYPAFVYSDALSVSGRNPRYFTDGSGKAVFLAGSHTWRNFQAFDADNFDFPSYLSFLKSNNLNFMRLWIWENVKGPSGWGPNVAVSPIPFAKSGTKYDLSTFNQSFFDRLRQHTMDAGNQGIYVSIQLFNGWSVGSKNGSPSPWKNHPFNSLNNTNGINGDTNGDGQGYEVETLANPAVTAIQDLYVKKVIDSVNDLDNVLFEIANESEGNQASVDWQKHMIVLIHDYEKTKPKQHPVGFTVPYPNGDNGTLFSSNADWIAPNDGGGYKDNPPVNTGSKVVISDTDHLWGLGGDRYWVWKSFARGHMFSYMDCYVEDSIGCPISRNDPARLSLLKNMGYARSYADKMILNEMTPQGSVSSTNYALVNTGKEYLIYQPNNGSFTVNLPNGNYTTEWLNPETGAVTNGSAITGGGNKTLTPPFGNDAVVYLKTGEVSSAPTPGPTGIVIGNGEADGVSPVNNLDIRFVLYNWLKSFGLSDGAGANQFGDAKVNSFDFAVVIKAIYP